MEEAIKHYMDIVRYKGININHFPVSRRLSNVDPELMRRFQDRNTLILRYLIVRSVTHCQRILQIISIRTGSRVYSDTIKICLNVSCCFQQSGT